VLFLLQRPPPGNGGSARGAARHSPWTKAPVSGRRRTRAGVWEGSTSRPGAGKAHRLWACAALTFRSSCSSCLRRETDRIGEQCSRKPSAPLGIGGALRAGMKPRAGEGNVAAAQPSARPCFATDPVARAAVCIACGLWSLTSPALAQAPAPTSDLQGQPMQPRQGGKPIAFRQPRPAAFDKAIPGNATLAKPGNEGVGQEVPGNVQEQVLLPLLLEEKSLLANYGPAHPDVRSLRERIQVVREYLAQYSPAPPPTTLAPQPPIAVPTPCREAPRTTARTSSAPGQTPPLPFPLVASAPPSASLQGPEVQQQGNPGQAALAQNSASAGAGGPLPGADTAPEKRAVLPAAPPTDRGQSSPPPSLTVDGVGSGWPTSGPAVRDARTGAWHQAFAPAAPQPAPAPLSPSAVLGRPRSVDVAGNRGSTPQPQCPSSRCSSEPSGCDAAILGPPRPQYCSSPSGPAENKCFQARMQPPATLCRPSPCSVKKETWCPCRRPLLPGGENGWWPDLRPVAYDAYDRP
jgi:hypothetical protein